MEKTFRNKWAELTLGFCKPAFKIAPASYFDERAQIYFNPSILIPLIGIFFTGLSLWSLCWIPFLFIGWGKLFISLPIYSGIDECDPPEYGFYFYGERTIFDTFVWCWKNKTYHFEMPWNWEWFRTSIWKKDGNWEHSYKPGFWHKGTRKDFLDSSWDDIIWRESYSYTYTFNNGEVQHRIATIQVEEREWRWKWLMFLPFPKIINKTIDISFNDEVGEGTGSWKGGTVGCSYSMKKGETPLETLRRMEKVRRFR